MEIKWPFYTKVMFTRDTLKNILSVIQPRHHWHNAKQLLVVFFLKTLRVNKA